MRLILLLFLLIIIATPACVEPAPVDLAGLGEPCTSFDDCVSGRCHAQSYCTTDCTTSDTCETAGFEGGCCVGESADAGYCIDSEDCADVCGPNAEPRGLPTVCECLPGYGPAPQGQRGCVPLLGPGEACDAGNSCESGLCLRNDVSERWCSHACNTDIDCTDITNANQVYASCCAPNSQGDTFCAINASCP